MRIGGDWLDHPGTQALCAALEAAGFQALLVGGCVRNALMGRAVADVDLATDAPPETVTAIAERVGFRVVPTGLAHGTVTIIARHRPHEVTTFRRDVETFGRHATVAFSTEVAEDAARRDFTMNALYADARGQVIDPLSGLSDLRAGRVRFVGDPARRIAEDYLRILRFFRFYAHYGDPLAGIDAEGLAACAALSAGLETLSRERIGAEMKKLLAAPDPAPAVAAMAQAGILAHVLPGAEIAALAPLVHLEADLPPDPLRRLAVLGGDTAPLRLSNREAATLASLRDAIGSAETPAVLGWRLGADMARDVLLMRAAVLQTPHRAEAAEIARGAAARFPVTSADLMPALQGPALGAELRRLTALWLASDLTLTRDQLLARDGT